MKLLTAQRDSFMPLRSSVAYAAFAAGSKCVNNLSSVAAARVGSIKDDYTLNAKIPFEHLGVRFDLKGWPFVGNMSIVNNVGATR
jgi:hypothetical protein